MTKLGITLTYQTDAWEGEIHRAEGWIARCDGGAFYGRTRKAAYMRAYRFLKSK